MSTLYDKTGREIMVGDILKVFHFIGRRWGRHYYMYKQVLRELTFGDENPRPFFYVSHLNMKTEREQDAGYYELRDGRVLEHVEIVQGCRSDHHDRPRIEVSK